jgi:hypothetical protein
MHTPKSLHHTAVTLKTFCTLLILIFLTGFVQLITIEIYKGIFRYPDADKPVTETTDLEKKQIDIWSSQKEFGPDGTLYLVNYNVTVPGIPGEGNTIVKDSNNNTLFTGKEKDDPYSFIQWYPKTENNYSNQTIRLETLNNLNMTNGNFTSSYAIPMVNLENKRIGHWFFDTQKRYFKYYSVSGSISGYLGANGYTENLSHIESFDECISIDHWLSPKSYDPMLLYRTEFALYQIDFQNKQVETLVKTPNDPIRSMKMNNWQKTNTSKCRPTLTVITKSHKLFLFLKNPKQVIETQLPSDFHYFNTPDIAAAGDKIWAELTETLGAPKTVNRNIYISWYRANQDKPLEYRVRLFELNKNGSFLEKNSFTWTGPKRQPKSVYQARFEIFGRFINSFSSPLTRWIYDRVEKQMYNYNNLPMYVGVILGFIQETSKFNRLVNFCFITIFAAATLLHGWPRRTSAIKLVFWVGFVFLFNLAGFLTYLALNHTPVVKCASCGKRRGLEKDACCRCGTVLPLPKSKETDLITTLSA